MAFADGCVQVPVRHDAGTFATISSTLPPCALSLISFVTFIVLAEIVRYPLLSSVTSVSIRLGPGLHAVIV